MKVVVSCPKGHRFKCDERHLGRKVKCPHGGCGVGFKIERARETSTAKQREGGASQESGTRCPICGKKLSHGEALCDECLTDRANCRAAPKGANDDSVTSADPGTVPGAEAASSESTAASPAQMNAFQPSITSKWIGQLQYGAGFLFIGVLVPPFNTMFSAAHVSLIVIGGFLLTCPSANAELPSRVRLVRWVVRLTLIAVPIVWAKVAMTSAVSFSLFAGLDLLLGGLVVPLLGLYYVGQISRWLSFHTVVRLIRYMWRAIGVCVLLLLLPPFRLPSPYDLILVVLVLNLWLTILWRFEKELHSTRRTLGHFVCLHCGHTLHGVHDPRCPSCGRPFEPPTDRDVSVIQRIGRPLPEPGPS